MSKKVLLRIFFHVTLLLVSTVLIVIFLPREQTYTYDYTVGKPWKYGRIIADFDFPIYKSEKAIQVERDSIHKLFEPYYSIDGNEGERQVRNFTNDYDAGKMGKVPPSYVKYVVDCLRNVYEKGIIESEDYSALLDSGVINIRFVVGTTSQLRSVKELYTTRSAYMHILLGDSANFRHDVLSQCNVNNYLSTNLVMNKIKSRGAYLDLLSSISYASGMVQSGQKIIDRGEIVSPRTVSILESMKKESIKRHSDSGKERLILLGQLVDVIMILMMFVLYLKLFRLDYLNSPRSLFFLYFLIVIFPVATSLVQYNTAQSVYLIPYTMVPIFVRVFMDARTSFIAHIVTILLCSLSLHAPYEFVLIQFLAGSVAVFSVKELSSRSQIFRSALQVTFATLLFMLAYDLSQGLTFKNFDPSWYICICINGVLLLFAYPLMYVIERLFGFTSSVTLIELSNVNMPLLREMSKVARGTFNHSMQVANLATEVAGKVGAKVELVRTGALYHDIGKIKNPAFFTENQSGVNPHDSLTEERSAQIIIQHVPDGLEMAEKYNLPPVLRGFIATHHGRSKTKYFYINYVNKHPNEPVNDELFTYPGPNPTSLEQAILMMSDSVEAASRSLEVINDDTLRNLVNDIVDSQVNEGYFRDC
ncbi:MAG: HDIG domain-containing protein, partial [Bacteroidaceae bacterium]|nr:HDIG domain-containing protein [Bacteroidaceae bacterium]